MSRRRVLPTIFVLLLSCTFAACADPKEEPHVKEPNTIDILVNTANHINDIVKYSDTPFQDLQVRPKPVVRSTHLELAQRVVSLTRRALGR